MTGHPTALIAEDEPLLRQALAAQLAQAWPELAVVAQVRNGREAVAQFEVLRPDVCFLDVHMPGLSGIEAARQIGERAHLVFVTAFDHYAVEAFARGALDYLVKPVEKARLVETVGRLRRRLAAAGPAANIDVLLRLAAQLPRKQPDTREPLRWIRAQVGRTLRLVATEDIDYIRADAKYTLIAWHTEGRQPAEAVIRTPLRELAPRLDPMLFVQVHRGCIVNLRAIDHVRRTDREVAEIHLRGRDEMLPISRSFLHLFRQM